MKPAQKIEPLVTVSMPIYNGQKTIGRALDSILAQTYQNLEIIISDNNSEDDSYEICRSYQEKDRRIILQKQQKNIGVYKNTRSICSRATGKYVLLAGCDDYWEPLFLEKTVALMEASPDAALAACRAQYYDERGNFLESKPLKNLEKTNISHAIIRLYHLLCIGQEKHNYNRYILGLLRLDLLKKLLERYPDLPGDCSFLAPFACDHGFLYIDEPLMKKIKNDKPFRERYRDDPYSIKQRHLLSSRLTRIKLDLDRFSYLYSSGLVSLKSKLLVLPVIFVIVILSLGVEFITNAAKRLAARLPYKSNEKRRV